MHYFTRNMARLRKETFVDKFGTTLKVLDSTERWAVLLQYLNHANTETHMAFPGAKTLAEETGLDRRNVRDRRDELVKAGWLTRAGSVDYGQQSEKLPGTGKKGRKSAVAAYLVTLPGMADELPLQGGVVRGVTGGVTGGVTTTPQTQTGTIKPLQTFSEGSGQPSKARGEKKKQMNPAAVLAEEVAAQLLQNYPDRGGLKIKKARELLPLCEVVLAMPHAGIEREAARRVVAARYQGQKPAKHDLAVLEGRDVPFFRAADQPTVVPLSREQRMAALQEGLAESQKTG